MIIQFPNGAGIESSIIASIHVSPGERCSETKTLPPRIQVYTMRGGELSLFGHASRPAAAHFMTIPMPSDAEAEAECRRLVQEWAGMPLKVKL